MAEPARDLPVNVTADDLTRPSYDAGDYIDREQEAAVAAAVGVESYYAPRLFMYYRLADQWVLTTLQISAASPRQRSRGVSADRYYAVGTKDGKVYTVGRGPHVKEVIEVHLKKSNFERLRPVIRLFAQGLADAQKIRDRISSRRAQGQIHRANGETSWRWDA